MKVELIKILGKKVVEIDGIKIEVELRMFKNCWGKIAFKSWSRFLPIESPHKILKERYGRKKSKEEKKK